MQSTGAYSKLLKFCYNNFALYTQGPYTAGNISILCKNSIDHGFFLKKPCKKGSFFTSGLTHLVP